jgi:GR25 family glycosyltransferase involved in LPS biosynthesis
MIFDKAYVISLEDSEDRRAQFYKYSKKAGIDVEWFPAVNGRKLDFEKLLTDEIISSDIDESQKGTLGCTLSHRGVWKKFLDDGGEVALVFEDDSIISPKFLKQIGNLDFNALGEWDMIWLGTFKLNCTPFNKQFGIPNAVGGGNTGQYGYLVHRRAVEKLADMLVPYKNKGHDMVLRNNFKNFNAYFALNRIVKAHRFRFPSIRKELNKKNNKAQLTRIEKVVKWIRQ